MEIQSVTENCEKRSTPAEVVDAGNVRKNDLGRTLGDGQEEIMNDSAKVNQHAGEATEIDCTRPECTADSTGDLGAKTTEKQATVVSENPGSFHNYDFGLFMNNAEATNVSISDLTDIGKDKYLKKEEQTEQDFTDVSESADLPTTHVSNALPEDRDARCSEKDSCSMPSIFSLLRVWSDGSPHRLKNLEHATLIIKNLLCEHLPGFAAKETIPDTPECLLILLQDCLSQYRSMNNTLKSRQKELELELEESRRTGAERYQVLVEEHKERLSRVFQDHEQQLTAAVERAINSRRQAGSLHAQLALAQAKIEQMESERKEYTEFIMIEHRKKLNELNEAKEILLSRTEQLEEKLKIKEAELNAAEERRRELENKNKTELVQEQEYLKKVEKQLAAEISTSTILQDELKQERQHNQDLWLEADRKAQELAAVQSKLETSHREIMHKDRLLQMLREEILEKSCSDFQESLDHSSLISDNGMSVSWLSSIKQQISDATIEIQEKSNILALKELTLTDVEKELKKKEVRIESIKQEQTLTELTFKQLSEELNKKKEQINKLTLHIKKMDKKIIAVLEQAAEKNKLLQSLKAELEEICSQAQQMMVKIKEENLKRKEMESKVIASEQLNKQLVEKLKHNKKEEDLLKSQYLLKQNHVDHLQKAIESKNKIITNLEQKLSKKDDQLTNLISTTADNMLDSVVISPTMCNDYALSSKGNETLSATKNATFNREKSSPCCSGRKNYSDTETKQVVVNSADQKLGSSSTQPVDQRKSVRVKQSTKYRRRLEDYYSPKKPPFSDSEPVSSGNFVSLLLPSSSDQLVSRDTFLIDQFALPSNSKSVKCDVFPQNQTSEATQHIQKDVYHGYSHSISPVKANSPLTVNINLQPPSIQFQQQTLENSESERMCCNVAIDMKSLHSPFKQHKSADASPSVAQKEKQISPMKNITPHISRYHSVQTTVPSATPPNRESYYPRSSTPLSKEGPVHKLIDTNSGFTVFSDSCGSEQEERLPVEGGEQI